MNRCKYCRRIQFKPLDNLGLCRKCGSIEGRLSLASALITYSSDNINVLRYIQSIKDNKLRGAEIVALCHDIDHPKADWYMLQGYMLKGAKFRNEQVRFCKKILQGKQLDERSRHYVLSVLADAYEGNYMFKEAIETLKRQESNTPAHIKIALLMVKDNRIDEAISYLKNVLEQLKKNPVYYTNPLTEKTELDHAYKSDLRSIPIHIEELEDKKKRGYVYRPRKKQNR